MSMDELTWVKTEELVKVQNSLEIEEVTFVWFVWNYFEQKYFSPKLEQEEMIDNLFIKYCDIDNF